MASTTTSARSTVSDFEDEIVVETIPMSYEDFLEWYDGDAGRRGEWVDGEVIPFMTTSDRHQRIISILVSLLTNYLLLRPGGQVFSQTFELRSRERAAREPDILVVLDRNRDRVQSVRVVGAADLVVEVVSPDSVTRDRRVKFAEYAAAGVPEYWLVDPRDGREAIDVFTLDGRGGYKAVLADTSGRLMSSSLPGLWAHPGWLVGDDMPDVIRLAMRMAGVDSISN